jgi:hypothetical protein
MHLVRLPKSLNQRITIALMALLGLLSPLKASPQDSSLLASYAHLYAPYTSSLRTPRNPNREMQKHFFWGIAFSGTSARMKMELAPEYWQRTDSIQSIVPLAQAGGGFGGSVAYRIGKFWEVKMMTMLQLHQRDIQYTWQHLPGPRVKIETISFDIPLTLKYRSDMPGNTRMYVLGGARWSHDFQSNETVVIGASKPLIALKANTFYYEVGAGLEFRLDYVDLSIELKASTGLNNALVRVPESYYSGSLSAIYPRLISLSLMAQN